MTHIVAGYPTMEESERIAETMLDIPVGFLEIQIPFSDPIGDGPTITKACRTALDAGGKVEDCFQLMERLQKKTEIPILFMTYYNIIFQYGVAAFCKRASQLGVYGLIVPDLPFDTEGEECFFESCRTYGLKAIHIVSPLTPEERLKQLGNIAEGFVYCVSGFGITGTKQSRKESLEDYLGRVRMHIKIPLALGFGISSKEGIEQAGEVADIVVIGSKILSMYRDDPGEEGLQKIRDLLS